MKIAIPSVKLSSFMKPRETSCKTRSRFVAVVLAAVAAVSLFSAQAAPNVSHTLTSNGSNNLSTATWTGGAPTNLTIGDMAIYSTAATASTTTIDINTTVGGFRTNSTGVWTLSAGAGTLTLDATGLTAGNSPFGNAGVAFLANTSTAAGGLTVNSTISIANTNLDIGTTNTGSVLIGGAITATTAQSLNLRANGAGAITDSAAIGASGSSIAISNLGTSNGTVTLSGALGASVASVTQNSTTSSLTLSGANTSFAGSVNLTAGTLSIGNASAIGNGTLTIAAGTKIDRANLNAGALTGSFSQVWNGNFSFVGTVAMDMGASNVALGNDVTVSLLGISGRTLTIGGIISGTQALTLAGGSAGFVFTGANIYSGATTVSGGTVNVGTATVGTGSINSTSGVTVSGVGSVLKLDNTITVAERINNSANLALSKGGEFNLTQGNTVTSATENISGLGIDTGSSIVTVASATGRVTTLAASGFSRSNNATALIRGTSMDQSATTNVSRLTLTSIAGLTFVGTNTLNNAGTADATQAVKIVPYLIGDTVATNTGKNFVTYDTTLGLRVLTAAEDTALAAGSTTQANPINATAPTGTTTMTNSVTVNSLLFNGATVATLTGNGSNSLTVASGAVANVMTVGDTIGSGFTLLNLDNNEGVLTAAGTGNLTVATPIDVTSGGSHSAAGALTKSGAGTVILSATNLYSGVTTINQGTLQIGNGTSGNLAAGSGVITAASSGATLGIDLANNDTLANAIVNNGTISKTVGANSNTLSGNISGTGVVTQSIAGGTLVLSGTNTYTGATTAGAGTLNLTGSLASSNIATSGTGSFTESAAGVISGTGTTFTQGSSGTSTLAGNNTYTGATAVNTGTLVLSGTNTSAGINIADLATLRLVATASNTTAGVSSAFGSGTLTSGSTGNAAPSFQFRSDSSVTFTMPNIIGGSATGNFTFDVNNVAAVNGSGPTGNTLTFSGTYGPGGPSGGATSDHNQSTNVTGGNGYSLSLGTVLVQGQQTAGHSNFFTVASGLELKIATLTQQNNAKGTTGGAPLTFNGAGTTTISALTSIAGTRSDISVTNGTLNLNGSNNLSTQYFGPTVTMTGGTLNLGNAGALNDTFATVAALIQSGGGTIDNTGTGGSAFTTLNQNITQNWNGNFTFTGTNSLNMGTGAVTLGATPTVTVNANTLTVGGVIGGSGFGLIKAGTGTLASTGANTYDGLTTVSAGTLLINGSSTGSAMTVSNTDSILGGNGTITPGASHALTVNSGAFLAPGVSGTTGTLTVALNNTGDSATFDTGAKFAFGLKAPGTSDVLAFTGLTASVQDVTFNGNDVNFTDLVGLAAGSYTLFTFDASSAYTGTLAIGTGLESFAGSGFIYNANNIVLNVVPEPATWGLLAFSLTTVVALRRRR